jgi:hypothetical protein
MRRKVMDSVSPVWTEEEVPIELVVALDQTEYIPIIVLPICYGDGTRALSVRFRFTEEERKAIAEGADLIFTELTFGGRFSPVAAHICKPNERPF